MTECRLQTCCILTGVQEKASDFINAHSPSREQGRCTTSTTMGSSTTDKRYICASAGVSKPSAMMLGFDLCDIMQAKPFLQRHICIHISPMLVCPEQSIQPYSMNSRSRALMAAAGAALGVMILLSEILEHAKLECAIFTQAATTMICCHQCFSTVDQAMQLMRQLLLGGTMLKMLVAQLQAIN